LPAEPAAPKARVEPRRPSQRNRLHQREPRSPLNLLSLPKALKERRAPTALTANGVHTGLGILQRKPSRAKRRPLWLRTGRND
jgi:hypothetical protein